VPHLLGGAGYSGPVSARWRAVAPAAWIFITSRFGLAAVAAVTVLVFDGASNPERGRWDSPRLHDAGAVVDVWARWDSDWYLRIAEHGYSWPSSTPAFFPLYPLLVSGLGRILLDHFVLAGVAVSLTAGVAAFALLFRLCERRLGQDEATWAVVFLAVFPTAFFFGAVYSESLYLLLALGTFHAAERGRFGLAGSAAGLAMLTRPVGIALLPALVLFAWRARDRARAAAGVALAAAVGFLYPLTLWAWLGRPLAFVDAQGVVWGRALSSTGPLGGIAAAASDLRPVDAAVACGLAVGGVAAWRMFGSPYGAYTLSALAIPLAVFAGDDPLQSIQRFAVVAFPAFMVLGALLARSRARFPLAALLAAWSACYVVRWSLWYWVA
jgi:Mannosyltransferase (PIG-V)